MLGGSIVFFFTVPMFLVQPYLSAVHRKPGACSDRADRA